MLGHSTRELLGKCLAHWPDLESLTGSCRRLDKYYITARYPDGLPGGIPHDFFDAEEAAQAISLGAQILAVAASIIECRAIS